MATGMDASAAHAPVAALGLAPKADRKDPYPDGIFDIADAMIASRSAECLFRVKLRPALLFSLGRLSNL
jgi:hypothetical protein